MSETKIAYSDINNDIISFMTNTGWKYYAVVALFAVASLVCFWIPWGIQIMVGQGVTGLNVPNLWGLYLVNFIFWVGIAHAGTLISAMLYITKTPWRRSIARAAETMTLFGLVIVTLFIFIHMGRPWNLYWTQPYPSTRMIWTNFQSPIMFDVFAIGTYFTSSVIFLFFGMIPDFAVLKHNTTGWRKELYTLLSFNWKGTDTQWFIHGRATMLFASFIMPLVVSVHSIVSWDFALSVVPGYSKTVFAPYFVTGALLSGFAGVTVMLTILRWGCPPFKKYITEYHYDSMGKVILLLCFVWTYLTAMEIVTGLYANISVENESLRYKILSWPHGYLFFFMLFCNSIVPLIYIFKRVRIKPWLVMIACIFILTGMWLERFLIVPNALSRKFLPWMWHEYFPTLVEILISVGAVTFFIMLFMISIKIFPVLSFFEVKEDQGVPMKKEGH